MKPSTKPSSETTVLIAEIVGLGKLSEQIGADELTSIMNE